MSLPVIKTIPHYAGTGPNHEVPLIWDRNDGRAPPAIGDVVHHHLMGRCKVVGYTVMGRRLTVAMIPESQHYAKHAYRAMGSCFDYLEAAHDLPLPIDGWMK